jgi:nucleoside-diphosphate kinase
MQDTYLMIKPEAFAAGHLAAILSQAVANGFEICRIRTLRMDRSQAEEFYAVHRERPFFSDLVSYMTSGTVVGVHLRRDDAVRRLRELVGATDPGQASCGTIRFRFGRSIQENAVHASDSVDNAGRELEIVFGRA